MTQLIEFAYQMSLKSILSNGNEIPISFMEYIFNYAKFFTGSHQGKLNSRTKPSRLEDLSKLKSEVRQFNTLKFDIKRNIARIPADHDINSPDLKKSYVVKIDMILKSELNKFNTTRMTQLTQILEAFQYNRIYQPKY